MIRGSIYTSKNTKLMPKLIFGQVTIDISESMKQNFRIKYKNDERLCNSLDIFTQFKIPPHLD